MGPCDPHGGSLKTRPRQFNRSKNEEPEHGLDVALKMALAPRLPLDLHFIPQVRWEKQKRHKKATQKSNSETTIKNKNSKG